ncbi:MAG TPA: hypothetical protein VG899_01515 [Mycobacteriales bacterium]|nr:hypothetical protein [Mycobacteriales bacterium]
MQKLAVCATLAVAIGGAGLTAASAANGATAGSCGPAHRYIDARSATVEPDDVTVVRGRSATLRCGGDDDSSYVPGAKLTLTLTSAATVTVWKMPENPAAGTRTVPATKLPTWLHKNRAEPIYKITGSNGHVTKLVEEWHP